MERLLVIKIGGNIIDDKEKLSAFLKDFATVNGKKILVHGGGKLATRLAEQLNIPQQIVEGRRITDAETLKVITMVYAGLINKNIVVALQSTDCNAVGITGADGNTIQAHKRIQSSIDYGFAGDIDLINTDFLQALLKDNYTPVVSPLTHDKKGQLLNTNADTIAQELARALSKDYEVTLIYSFEKEGVLLDVNDENSVIRQLNFSYYCQLKQEGTIFAGMIPKLDNAFKALESGIKRICIGKAETIIDLINGEKGTSITNEFR